MPEDDPELLHESDSEAEDQDQDDDLFSIPEPSDPTITVEIETNEYSASVCDECFEKNLIENVSIQSCSRCKNPFCLHFSSKIDPSFCVSCMSDLTVEKSVVTKTYEHVSEDGTLSTTSRRARQIKISGLDWLFAQRKIATLTDVESDMAIEYHRGMLTLHLTDNERRKNERIHRYAGVKITSPIPTVATIRTSEKKTTVKSVSNKKTEQVAAMMGVLLGQGKSIEDIMKILKGGKSS